MHPNMSQAAIDEDDGGFSISAVITEDGVRTPVVPPVIHPPSLVDQYASDSDDSLSSDNHSEEESEEKVSSGTVASVKVLSSSTSSVKTPAANASVAKVPNGSQKRTCADDEVIVPDTDDDIIIPGTPEEDEANKSATRTEPGDETNTVSEKSPDGPDGCAKPRNAGPLNSSNSAKKVHFLEEVEVCEYPEEYARVLMKSEKRSHSSVCQRPAKLRPRPSARNMALRLILHSSYQPSKSEISNAEDNDAEDALKILEEDLEQIKEDSGVAIEDADIDLAETQDELEDIEQKLREEKVAKMRSKLKKRRRENHATDAPEALNDTKVEKTRDVTSKFYMRQRKKQRSILDSTDSSTGAAHSADSFILELAESNWGGGSKAKKSPVLLAMRVESSIDGSRAGNKIDSSEADGNISNFMDQGDI